MIATIQTSAMAASALAADRPLRELRGVVERIAYLNPENDFTVARLGPERPEAEEEAAPPPCHERTGHIV
jgi:hypothetical protein